MAGKDLLLELSMSMADNSDSCLFFSVFVRLCAQSVGENRCLLTDYICGTVIKIDFRFYDGTPRKKKRINEKSTCVSIKPLA